MPRHLEQVLAHAENQLATAGGTRPTEVLPLYKKFLKIEEHRLRLKHQAGGGGREICALRVDLIDVLLRHVFNAASAAAQPAGGKKGAPAPLALIGLGGYGRRELNPFSDVDVMILHGAASGGVSPYIEQVVEQILYLLWDIGFKVGHSTRSIKEALAQANRDMLTKTAMLESRFLAGEAVLAQKFRAQFRAKCVTGHEREYIEMRMQDQIARHKKYGDSVYVQEPNVKNACGGLRDYQNLLWLTFFKEGALTTTHLVGRNWLSESDQRRIDLAYDFLLRIRTDLHYVNNRASDVLHFNVQDQIARRLGYRAQRGQLRSEVLMRDFYNNTRNIFRVTERITEQFRTGQAIGPVRSLFGFLPLTQSKSQRVESFLVRNQKLFPEKRDLFDEDPVRMMRMFQLAQQNNWGLSPELEDLISRRLGKINKVYQYAKAPREIFMSILLEKGDVGRILRMMHGVDFLGRYIPEFGQLTCLVQHEFFHRYTADEHTLVCIDKLDELKQTEDFKLVPYRQLFEKLEDPIVLYLALLLHDTGRAVRARPHSEASALFANRVASRLQLSSEQRKSLVLLVDHHVSLSTIAQQRNLDDPATIAEFAGIVKNHKNLDSLMLLTLADGQGTGAAAWSDWKETLVWQLFRRTSQYLTDQKSYYEQTKIERESLQAEILNDLSPDYRDEVDAHFEFMPDNYFRASEPRKIAQHLRLFRAFFGNATGGDRPLAPAVAWESFPSEGHTIVSLCNWHREQLLAKIAGAFAIIPLNILSVDTFARGDHAVLDILRVCDVDGGAVSDPRVSRIVEETLRGALEDEAFDFGSRIEKARRETRQRTGHEIDFPTSIAIDNRAHPAYTLVQIQTPDRIGLLYDLLSCFGNQGISIGLSRISTQNGAAIDTFYLNDAGTRGKLTDAGRIALLQQRLHAAIVSEK